jgi:hypothetical protein
MSGWYRRVTGGYLQSMEKILLPKAYHEPGFPSSYDVLFIFTCSGIENFFFPGPTKLHRFSATVCLSHILKFTYESIKNRPAQPLWSHCWKLRRYNGVRWLNIKILFGYFINHTTHLIHYVLINCYCWKYNFPCPQIKLLVGQYNTSFRFLSELLRRGMGINGWPQVGDSLRFLLINQLPHFFLSNQPDALIIEIYSVLNSTCFGHLLCPSSGVFYCTFGTDKFHAGFWWPLPSRVRMEHPNFILL